MLPLRHLTFWRIAGAALICLVLAFALLPAAWMFGNRAGGLSLIPHADKVLHAMTFLALMVWFSGQYQRPSYLRVAAGLVLFGLLVEGCQFLLGYRQADVLDMAANASGIAAGFFMAIAGAGGWSQRIEQWYASRGAGTGVG